MFKNIGTTEIVVIAVLLLVLFGGKKVPEFAKLIIDYIKRYQKPRER